MKKIIILTFAIASFFYAEAQQGLQISNWLWNTNTLIMNGEVTHMTKQEIIDWGIRNGYLLPIQETIPDKLWLYNAWTGQQTCFFRQRDGSWKC